MGEQTSLLELANEAISHAAQGANAEWMREAWDAVSLLCKRGRDFTTDDVWRLMTLVHIETRDSRALGAVMRQAAREKLIIPTGQYQKSTRRECHRRPVAVWRPL